MGIRVWNKIFKFVKIKFLKVILSIFAIVTVAAAALFIVAQIIVLKSAEGKFFSVNNVPFETVVIVPGASVLRSGQPSDMLADRLLTALDLYKSGKVKRFLLSGDHGQTNYNEVEIMRDFLLERGVLEEVIYLDHAGFDTFDTMIRAHEIFQLESAVVVTQKYHLSRALYLGQNIGLEVCGVPADRQDYLKMPYFLAREYLARVKAVLDIWFHAQPKYLGEAITIL